MTREKEEFGGLMQPSPAIMNVIDDEIAQILHAGGVEIEGVIVDRYTILLRSCRCFELTDHGPVAASCGTMLPDRAFDRYIGLRIVSLQPPDPYPGWGIRLSDGTTLVMGSPYPYYFGLQVAEGDSNV